MGSIQVTNATGAKLFIDVDAGERTNRYAKWVFNAGEVKSIGEEEIVVGVDQALPDALRSGQATVTESDIDSLSSLPVKDFLASGLDIGYKVSNGALLNKRIVMLDSTNNKVQYVTAQGVKPYGGLRQDSTNGVNARVKTAGTITVECGGTVTSGAYLVSDTTGRAVASTTTGDWIIALAGSDGTTNQQISVTVNIKQIP